MATKREGIACYDKADPDEPLFVLRAQDRLAPVLVRLWADLAAQHGCPEPKVMGARVAAMKMEDWATKRGAKFPD
jgi:hypothetical protein